MNHTSQQTSQQFIRMSGTDQVVWNLVDDQDLFCIWGIASLTEPLQDALVEQSLKYLLQTIPILNTRPVTTWFSGKWQFLAKENVGELIVRVQTANDAEAEAKTEEQLQKVFTNPIKAKDAAMIRLHSIDGPEKHYFVIQVHHLVVDGEGLKRICAQFAEIYRAVYRDPSWQPDQILDPCRSLGQILRQAAPARFIRELPAYLISLIKLLMKTVPALRQRKKAGYRLINTAISTAETDNDPALALLPFFARTVLDQEIMLAAKAFAKRQNVTLHDLLMTSFSLANMAWNTKRGDKRNWLRFSYTANLRRWWGEPNGTFGNFSAILTHEEVFHNLQSPNLALTATKAQLDQEKKHIGLDSFFVTMLLPALPYFLIRRGSLYLKEKMLAFARQNQAMTNIGIIPEQAGDFGHTQAEGYSLLAPTIAGGCLLFTISTYKDVLTLYLGCTEDALNREDAQDFLCLWKDKFLQVIAA
ncbi:Condensation domain-containing protein [Candidatus Electrothrix aarhusensis]